MTEEIKKQKQVGIAKSFCIFITKKDRQYRQYTDLINKDPLDEILNPLSFLQVICDMYFVHLSKWNLYLVPCKWFTMPADNAAYVIGLDFGTDSVRALLVDAGDGTEISSSVFSFPRWRDGLYCNAAENRFRQHPHDHIEGIEYSIKECLALAKP
jgi:hypothetical protein